MAGIPEVEAVNPNQWDPAILREIDECDLGIITCGNSGVGKSLIDNILLGLALFVHMYRATSVTRLTEVAFTTIHDRKTAVYNIPGLKEIQEANVESNKVQIEKAFEGRPVQVILSVFGVGDGGRIREEDLATHLAVQQAFAVHNASTIFVINNVHPRHMNAQYFTDTTVLLKEVLQWPAGQDLPIVFLESIPHEVDIMNDPKVHAFRAKLLDAIDKASPHKHVKEGPINTSKDLAKQAADDLDRARSEMVSLRAVHQEDINRLTRLYEEQQAASAALAQRHAQEMAAARANMESAMREVSRRRGGFLSGLFRRIGL